jgi:putative PEP-CTERM system histidine kinase
MNNAPALLSMVSLWGHAVCAILFAALAFWALGRSWQGHITRVTALATALTVGWALTVSMDGPNTIQSQVTESLRNGGWLFFMYYLWQQGERSEKHFSLTMLYGAVALLVVAGLLINILPLNAAGSPRILTAIFYTGIILNLMMAGSALLLVHNLYTAATPETREAIRMPMIALAVMWGYDLNLYTMSYLAFEFNLELMALRGVVIAMLAPLFGLALYEGRDTLPMRLSRTATFQTLSIAAIGGYLVAMVVISLVLDAFAGEYARNTKIILVFGMSVAGLLLLPSVRFRSWFRVKVSKHFFQHRYDYRAEWIRFTETIGRPTEHASSLDIRVVQAIADLTESPSGYLLAPDTVGGLTLKARWNWADLDIPLEAMSETAANLFTDTGRIVELDQLRDAGTSNEDEMAVIPIWLLQQKQAWAVVPLIHFGKLSGVVILSRPALDRTLDWEDFDVLKVVGRQVASYLAEARGQETLSHVQQFDEFNRRFAFIMHDIKNLVSQLGLITRNAEKHINNPEFQLDMLATLRNSTARMNEMLARLSQHNKAQADDPRPINIGTVIEQVAAQKRIAHPVVIGGTLDSYALADPARLEQSLSHLVQNAIDASQDSDPVSITTRQLRSEIIIDVEDKGIGMSGHFIRHNLFKPFSSTKEDGFGIGAYEARQLIMAMGGKLDVTSREGQGSVFRITLPLAKSPYPHSTIQPPHTQVAA